MQVYSDCLKLAADLLGSGIQWRQDPDRLADTLFSSIYPTAPHTVFKGDIEENDWNKLYLSKHAKESQFALLCHLMRAGRLDTGSIICCAGSGENFKGYRNRSWISVEGNIHLSIYLRPERFVEHFEVGFTIMAAVSLLQAIDDIPALAGQSLIKWVNDIQIDGAKVGGVITQTQVTGKRIDGVVIGLGLNVERIPPVAMDIFVPKVSALAHFHPCTRHEIFRPVIQKLYVNYKKLLHGQYQELLDSYIARSSIIGRKMHLYSDPLKGQPELITSGMISKIGPNLEIYFKNSAQPYYKGRLVDSSRQ